MFGRTATPDGDAPTDTTVPIPFERFTIAAELQPLSDVTAMLFTGSPATPSGAGLMQPGLVRSTVCVTLKFSPFETAGPGFRTSSAKMRGLDSMAAGTVTVIARLEITFVGSGMPSRRATDEELNPPPTIVKI